MPELTLYDNRTVHTVFDLLGDKEDDITYSLGWALTQSAALRHALLAEVFGREPSEVTAIGLQKPVPAAGRTDVEMETADLHLIIEAKRGWNLPLGEQLELYARRFEDGREAAIAVVAECSRDYAEPRLPQETGGVPVHYLPWTKVAELVEETATAVRSNREKALLREFHRYMRGLMTMVNVRDNMVYVLSLGTKRLGQSGLTFKDIVVEHGRYFHPVGGQRGGWPRTPPNYLAFRYWGELQQIRHVEGYTVVEPAVDGMPGFPQLEGNLTWKPGKHFLYELGPVIEPPKQVKSGTVKRALRVWAALDLLLTADTINEARDLTRERLANAGAG